MAREIIRIDPLSDYLEKWGAPTSAVIRDGDMLYVSGFPPYNLETGEVVELPIKEQTQRVLEQMKLCLDQAGSSLDKILKVNVYCSSSTRFADVNEVYSKFFGGKNFPARIWIPVAAWPGPFQIEVDCIATV